MAWTSDYTTFSEAMKNCRDALENAEAKSESIPLSVEIAKAWAFYAIAKAISEMGKAT